MRCPKLDMCCSLKLTCRKKRKKSDSSSKTFHSLLQRDAAHLFAFKLWLQAKVVSVRTITSNVEKVESGKFSFLSILSKADKQRICLKNMSEEGGGSQQQYQRSSHAASSSLCSVFNIFTFATFVVVFSVVFKFLPQYLSEARNHTREIHRLLRTLPKS